MDDTTLRTVSRVSQSDFSQMAESHRRELQVHCYRMLGSLQDAEDLVQETLMRAWQKLDTFEGRASFRAWLYKIATNACLDALDRRPRRALPQARAGASDPLAPPEPPITEPIWLEPYPDDLLDDATPTPEARYDARESITLAFLSALQILPARQRAVLILSDVLDWRAMEVSRALGLTVSAVNSALHRARATLAKHYGAQNHKALSATPSDDMTRMMLERYVRAWESADVDTLVAMLTEDATFPMPPMPSWYQGRAAIREFITARILAGDGRGRFRLVSTRANGQPAFGWYQRDDSGGVFRGFAIQVLTLEGGLIADVTTFMNPKLLARFGLPSELE